MYISIQDLTSIITVAIAMVGLLLSIYNFYIARRDKALRINLNLGNGYLTYKHGLSEFMLLIESNNPSEKSVNVTGIELNWNKRKLVFLNGIDGTERIPFELIPGKNASFWVEIREVARVLSEHGCTGKEEIRACLRSAIGKDFYSNKISIDIDEYVNK